MKNRPTAQCSGQKAKAREIKSTHFRAGLNKPCQHARQTLAFLFNKGKNVLIPIPDFQSNNCLGKDFRRRASDYEKYLTACLSVSSSSPSAILLAMDTAARLI
jgi:hypothetical protein